METAWVLEADTGPIRMRDNKRDVYGDRASCPAFCFAGRCISAGTYVSAFGRMLSQLYNDAKYYHGVEEYGRDGKQHTEKLERSISVSRISMFLLSL